jgi:copper resistance protein D
MTDALFAARWTHFIAVVILLGSLSFRLYAADSFIGAEEVRHAFDRWLRRVLLLAAVVSLLSAIAWLLVQSAIMGDGWASGLSGETLTAVLFQTEFGRMWAGRLVVTVLVIIVLVFYVRRSRTAGALGVAGLSLLLVASLAGTGHAMMDSGVDRIIDISVQAVHLLAVSVWLGGLVPLGYLLHSALQKPDASWLAVARSALPRYSHVGMAAVSLLTLTGIFMSSLLVGGIAGLFQTIYGQLLLAKIALFLIMVGVAVFNRVILLPKAVAATSHAAFAAVSMGNLWRNVVLEQALAILVLAVVSVLGTVPPGA